MKKLDPKYVSPDVLKLNPDIFSSQDENREPYAGETRLEVHYAMPSWNAIYATSNHHVRYKLAEEVHAAVKEAVAGDRKPYTVPVNITITDYRPRPIDPDNVVAKLIIDGLCEANVLVDDDFTWVHSVTTRCRKASKPKTEILIRESRESSGTRQHAA